MKILPAEVAKLIGASPEYVRLAIQQGRLGFGTAVKMGRKWSYNIQTEEIATKYGIKLSEIDAQLEKIRKGGEA